MGAAIVARHRLGMETAVEDGGVFFTARVTHFKGLHGGFVPVVGEVPDDGKAGAAIGAVGKGIVDAVGLGIHVLQTGFADADVGTDFGDFIGGGVAFGDDEFIVSFNFCRKMT